MLVHQILKAKSDDGVVTIPPETTVAAATELLSSRRIGAVIISADGKTPEGILSERDIVRELGRYIQGGGGGQPFYATAGGKHPDGLKEALEKAKSYIL